MIEALKELGEIKLKLDGRNINDLLSILVQDPNQDGKYPKVLVIVFVNEKNKYKYKNIIIEDTSKSKIEKYLYRRGASMGPDFTPTAKITDINRTFNTKIKGWFKKIENSNHLIIELKNSLLESETNIIKDLNDKWKSVKSSLEKNHSAIITIGIEENYKLNYIGDFSVFREFLISSVKEDYKKIVKTNHKCSICSKEKDEVYGDAIPIPFYVLDKPGYIAGGFKKEQSWKNAPVCFDCALKIGEAKKFLDENLRMKMGGMQYYLIPKFLLNVDLEEVQIIVDTFFKYLTHKDELLKSRILEKLTNDENEILQELGELKDLVSYNFLFFEADNPQVFKIKLLVEDILPSRINKIFKVKNDVENYQIFKNVNIKKYEYKNIQFNFDEFRRFIPTSKNFLEIIDKTFRGIFVDKNLIFSWFMTTIRENYQKENYLKIVTLQSFIALLFFKELGIITIKKEIEKGGKIMPELKEKAEILFSEFGETLNSPVKKALFLLGVLTEKLLKIQYKDRASTPFRKHLNSLRMKEEDFISLLPKIQNKLEEYGKNYYRSLEELISYYFLKSGRNWGLSIDEMNYYFVLGMNFVEIVDKVFGLTKEKEDLNE